MHAELPPTAPAGDAALLVDEGIRMGGVARGIAIVCALAAERGCLAPLAGGPDAAAAGVAFVQSGPGPQRAATRARAAVAAGAVGLVSWGFAAGIAPHVAPGTLMLPRRVLGPGAAVAQADDHWRAALLDALGAGFVASEADLLTVSEVLPTPEAKARAARSSGAVAADMESGAIAAVARQAGVPFVAVRVVLDAAGDRVPPGVERWIDEAGNRCAPALSTLMLHPRQWTALLVLARRYRKARQVLTAAARRLLPAAFAAASRAETLR